MLIQTGASGFIHPHGSAITSEAAYLQRREFLQWAVAGGLGFASGTAWADSDAFAGLKPMSAGVSPLSGARAGDKATSFADASGYNNFYEFGLGKEDPAKHAQAMPVRPWTVRVEGLVNKPQTFDLDALQKLSAQEERIYRMRCVEGWSMVIPWIGYSLSKLLAQVEPQGSAKYVEFVTLADPQCMPGLRRSVLSWPYTEGLRLDEAQHPLTLLTFGMYGHELPKQNGAPVRIMVPWKYGFKSPKSIVAIRLVETEPRTAWNKAARHEYGFYSNVNPDVPHRRWSQATERRIGDGLLAPKRKTQLFNGYAEQVAHLYSGMDLRQNF